MKPRCKLRVSVQCTVATFLVFTFWRAPAFAQDAAQKPVEKPTAKSAEKAATPGKAANPAQIELLETKVRFESNGDSRKEVHALVKINSELGVRQFAKLNFDYNRSFESIEIPLVHITHASGGTADILPSAVTDQPNPAVGNAPAYQDVRVKSVRILGLEPADTLEYRVITTASHYPLAPDFWFDHTFDRTGVVTQEILELDLPSSSGVQTRINPATPATSNNTTGEGTVARILYRWQRNSDGKIPERDQQSSGSGPDLVATSFRDWQEMAEKLTSELNFTILTSELHAKAREISKKGISPDQKLEALYAYVSKEIRTVDLPLGVTGFHLRQPSEIISSGYATSEEKCALLSALDSVLDSPHMTTPVLVLSTKDPWHDLPRPTLFSGVLSQSVVGRTKKYVWLDPGLEVAPFGLILATLRGQSAIMLASHSDALFETVPVDLPFTSSQKVNVDAGLGSDGKLTAKVHYAMRGDNELLLRVAFHQSAKEKWKELAQLLSITDGFRGQVTSVDASDPYATKEPFTLKYEIEQPKFVNWSKKTVRIPALLPQIGLPDPPAKPASGAAPSPIDLGTPLEVETQMTLRLPPGTTVQTPTGTSVQRDYATYASQYSAKGLTITASRHINFLLREIPAERAADYSTFLHAVQNDEAQDFTLERANPASPAAKQAEVKTQTPNKTVQPKP
jgi:hypothetical protein